MNSKQWLVLGALGLLNCIVLIFLVALVFLIVPTLRGGESTPVAVASPSALRTFTPMLTSIPPTPTILLVPTPTNTPVVVATNTPAVPPTGTPAPPTQTPVVPTPTNTSVVPPTAPPTDTPIPTNTPVPPTNTLVPQHEWTGSLGETYKNCGSTGVLGFTLDQGGGLAGDAVIHYWTDGWEGAWAVSSWSNTDYNKNWDGLLDNTGPRPGVWYVCIVPQQGSWECLSNQVTVETSGDCNTGPQWVQVNFRKN